MLRHRRPVGTRLRVAVACAAVLLLLGGIAWLSSPAGSVSAPSPGAGQESAWSGSSGGAPGSASAAGRLAKSAPLTGSADGPPTGRPKTDPGIADLELAAGVSEAELVSAIAPLGLTVRHYLPQIGWASVEAADGSDISSAKLGAIAESGVAKRAEHTGIAYAAAAPTDPLYSAQWGFKNTGQSGGIAGADMNAEPAWDWARGDDVVVAVIDQGVMTSHPDLAGRIWVNAAEASGTAGVDDDGNGYTDDINGWDFANDDATVYDAADGEVHGTHVAGTVAAAAGNSAGGVGTAWNAKIMSVKGLGGDGSGSYADLAAAIIYSVDMGAKISNNSWGGSMSDGVLVTAVNYAETHGQLMAVAAGNNGRDIDAVPSYPAAYTNANIVSVAALDRTDAVASYSNTGSVGVDLGAPGSAILSTKGLASAGIRTEATASGYTNPYSVFYYPFPVERLGAAGDPELGDAIIDASITQLATSTTAPILVVNDSWHTYLGGDSDFTSVYTGRLAALGYSNVTTWTVATQGTPALTSYNTVVWFTGLMSVAAGGSSRYTLTSAERTALTTYLNGGGNLLLSSAECADDLQSQLPAMGITTGKAFLWNYLRANEFHTTHQNAFYGAAGGPFDGLGGSTPDWLGEVNSAFVGDSICARAGATPLLYWSAEYLSLNGTSMATPHVAGALALAWSRTPTATATQIRDRLLSSTTAIPSLAGKCVTGGKLDAAAFVGQTAAPSALEAMPTGIDRIAVGWADDDTDAYFSATRVLGRLGAPVEGLDDPQAQLLYDGAAGAAQPSALATGTWHLAAYSRNALGSWTESATTQVMLDGRALVVTATGAPEVVVTFPTNWSAGVVTGAKVPLAEPGPPGKTLVGDASFDVSTTIAFSGEVSVTVDYDPTGLTPTEEQSIRLYHRDEGVWTELPSALDAPGDKVTGTAGSFSEFAVVYTDEPFDRFEQNDGRLYYESSWKSTTSGPLSGGTDAWVNDASGGVDIAFEGTGFAWISTKAPFYGIARVTVDGTSQTAVDLYAPGVAYQQRAFELSGLAPGAHTVRIEWTGSKNASATGTMVRLDAVEVVGALTQASAPELRFEHTDSRLLYEGVWKFTSSGSLSGGSDTWSNSAGGAVNVAFNGTAFTWIATKSPYYGMAKVMVDGSAETTVDLYAPGTGYQQPVLELEGLSPGAHTVRIAWTGEKNPASSGTMVRLDAVDVVGTLTQAASPFVRYEQTDGRLQKSGVWKATTSGALSGGSDGWTNSSGGAVYIAFDGTAFTWISTRSPQYGKARVIVDGSTETTVDLYATGTAYQQKVLALTGLPPGAHTVRIEWTGEKNTASSGTMVRLDAVEVLGVLTQAP